MGTGAGSTRSSPFFIQVLYVLIDFWDFSTSFSTCYRFSETDAHLFFKRFFSAQMPLFKSRQTGNMGERGGCDMQQDLRPGFEQLSIWHAR